MNEKLNRDGNIIVPQSPYIRFDRMTLDMRDVVYAALGSEREPGGTKLTIVFRVSPANILLHNKEFSLAVWAAMTKWWDNEEKEFV